MLNAKSRIGCAGAILLVLGIAVSALADPKIWREQGPGPILFESNTKVLPNSPAAGAINAIAANAGDPDLLYVGTVNGGIWKTTNATTATPNWTPLTDKSLPALSINSLAISPVDAKLLFAGTGSTSSLAGDGSPGFGIARSHNGGKSWTVLASSTFTGRPINNMVPTTLDKGNVVLAASLFNSAFIGDHSGVYRSTDMGNSFTRISGAAGSGLPDAGVSSLIADPSHASRLYAGVQSRFGGGSNAGVYRSDDGGLTWTFVSSGLTGQTNSFRILLAIHTFGRNNVVYAAIISNNTFRLSGVFRSTNRGGSWTSMGVPSPTIHPGQQGTIHGAIVAHPTDPQVVFIAGDRQASPFPNVNGCTSFSGNTFRGDSSLLPGNPWTSLDCNGANRTSPHPDARAMLFDANGNLLQANDGGIYRLSEPNNAIVRQWRDVNGDIRISELHSVVYDPLSKVIFGGTQDNGTPIQPAPGSPTWNQFRGGDGGNVAVDSDQTAHPGTTIRYTSFQNLGAFNRTNWDASNTRVGGLVLVQLRITSGPGTGMTLFQFDPNVQFYQPYVLNAIDPSRMLIGTANIYESLNRGDALANLGFTGFLIGDGLGASPLVYGGRLNGSANPDVFYVGAGPTIRHRVTLGGPTTTLSAYPGSSARGLVIDAQNYQRVFVLDDQSRVWATFDEGASWTNLTANLPTLSEDIRALEIFSHDATFEEKHAVLIVGGIGGVFQRRLPETDDPGEDDAWNVVGRELPHGLVRDLHFNAADNILLAAILGRGAWTLPNFFKRDERPSLAATEGQSTSVDPDRVAASRTEASELDGDVPSVPPMALLVEKPQDE